MTSTVIIDYTSPKDFTVEIDNIDSISPRGLELAFAKVEKRFAELKGIAIAARKVAERRDAVDKEKEEADEATMDRLVTEELARDKPAAMERAESRFETGESGNVSEVPPPEEVPEPDKVPEPEE